MPIFALSSPNGPYDFDTNAGPNYLLFWKQTVYRPWELSLPYRAIRRQELHEKGHGRGSNAMYGVIDVAALYVPLH